MNNLQYDYFVRNEPNFQTLQEWEKDTIELDFFSDKLLENSQNLEQHLKPIAGLEPVSEFL